MVGPKPVIFVRDSRSRVQKGPVKKYRNHFKLIPTDEILVRVLPQPRVAAEVIKPPTM